MLNCAGLCYFVGLSVQKTVDLVKAATGWPTSAFELMKLGERALQMTRYYDIREGMSKDEDKLPERFFTPFPAGPLKGRKLDRVAFEKARDIYYNIACWNKETGSPNLGKLQELGIDWIIEA